ncbi:unnamed protein product, partial [Mesorhabditis spiculigera]
MGEDEPPVLRAASSWKQPLKGWILTTILFFSSLYGVFYVLLPLWPILLFRPSTYRLLADRMIGLWLILPGGLLKFLFGIKVSVVGDFIEHAEPAVIIMNHRTRLDWLFFWTALYQQDPWLLTSEKISMKSILKYVPGAGWAMQVASYIFLDRTFEKDQPILRRILNYYSHIGNNYQVLLFPEGTDKCHRATARGKIFCEKKGIAEYEYLLHPRITGFVFMIQEMRKNNYIKYLYDVTIGFKDAIAQSEADMCFKGLVPTDIHYQIRKIPITELPEDDEGLKDWLTKLWAEKNEKLRDFYTRRRKSAETFENTPNGRSWPMTAEAGRFQDAIVIAWLTVSSVWAIGYLFLPLQWFYSFGCCLAIAIVSYRFGGLEWLSVTILENGWKKKRMVSVALSRFVVLTCGTLYPAYRSFKAVRTKDVREYVKWMMYWIVFALFIFIESIADLFVSFWFPFYYEAKILFVLWLLSPWTKGASILYRKWIHPALTKREKEIDALLDQAKSESYNQLVKIGSQSLVAARDIVAQAAIRGQAQIVQQLQRSVSAQDVNMEISERRRGKVDIQEIVEEVDSDHERDDRHHRNDDEGVQVRRRSSRSRSRNRQGAGSSFEPPEDYPATIPRRNPRRY